MVKKRAKLDAKQVTNLFQKTEPDNGSAVNQDEEFEVILEAETENRGIHVPGLIHKSYELVKLTALAGQWIYISQMTAADTIEEFIKEFIETNPNCCSVDLSKTPDGTIGYFVLSDFRNRISAGDAFRWFAKVLCHSGWEPFAADQSPPNTDIEEYRDSLFLRIEKIQYS